MDTLLVSIIRGLFYSALSDQQAKTLHVTVELVADISCVETATIAEIIKKLFPSK
jgi:hypothetical protein